ncbi:MAG: hypothetical protein MUF21_02400 [Gemmatimonadaceae bacterium]|jgi:hypothetical protein|nr:hypothetical protein [Gemmatimonadaceae bacterium]
MSLASIAGALPNLAAALPALTPRDADAADATRADGTRDDARTARAARDAAAPAIASRDAAPTGATGAADAQRALQRASALGPLTYGRGSSLAAATVAARGVRLDVTV